MADTPLPRRGRTRALIDTDWSFAFGHPSDTALDHGHGTGDFTHLSKAGYGDGPAAALFDDRGWRRLDLPHDWAAELPFSREASASHGYKALGAKFPETSVAWYRRRFRLDPADAGRRVWVGFDGVYRDAQFWVNGFHLGSEPSGYLGFRADITDYLDREGENVLSVRVDARFEEGWYYEGAGIYRHVWLEAFDALHIAHDGIFARSSLSGIDPEALTAASARLSVDAEIANDGERDASFYASFRLFGPDGALAASGRSDTAIADAGGRAIVQAEIEVPSPSLWSPESPCLYRLETAILRDGEPVGSIDAVDAVSVGYGFREAAFDPDSGFFLNGRRIELLGTNNHQDHAGVGTALPDALHAYRVRRLKEMGSNAYRCSHHPPARELLEACDRLGMLVVDENRLLGSTERDMDRLERMVRRDRNHPSVIAWSVCNEEWAVEGNPVGARLAKAMQARVRRLDPSREATAAVSGGWGSGISSVIGVMGYNYVSHGSTDEQHRLFPRQSGMGTEETTTQGTRGAYEDDAGRARLAPMENGTTGGNCETGWKHYAARPYLAGLFFWTGFDYRGEPAPLEWPAIGSQCGILDSCGFEKDSFWYLRSWWRGESAVRIAGHWNRERSEGRVTRVRVDSNAPEVELFLNGRTLGKKTMERNGHLEWETAYAPGSLLAVGYAEGREIARHEIRTAGAPARLRLSADRETLAADGRDAALVRVEILDEAGLPLPCAENEITFSIEGPGRLIGVGNGDPGSHEPDRFIAGVIDVPMRGWREKPVNDPIDAASAALPQGASGSAEGDPWSEAFVSPPWNVSLSDLPPPPPAILYRGEFELGPLEEGAVATLFLSSWSEALSAWVNGSLAASGLPPRPDGHHIALPLSALRQGSNSIVLLASGLGEKRRRFPATFVPARIRIDLPEPEWKRRLFNGLAQAIVQAGRTEGTCMLRAAAPGLAPAGVEFRIGGITADGARESRA